jgi:pilus assembly protein Flp/PilA
MRELMRRLLRDKKGATAVEYGLILAMIAVVMVVSLMLVANSTITMWNNVSSTVVSN